MTIENLIVVAHPDDEAIWFSSILRKPNTALVFCFQNKYYTKYEENLDYTTKVFDVINFYKSILPVVWLQTIKTTYPKIFGNLKEETYKHLSLNLENLLSIIEPYNVFTHNPWGEYGHSEHIAVHNAIRRLRERIIFPDFAPNDIDKKSSSYIVDIKNVRHYSIEDVDLEFKYSLRDFYKSLNLWSMKENIEYDLQEIFLKFK